MELMQNAVEKFGKLDILVNNAGLLGSVAPCVVYESNVERLGSAPGTFANHCLPYTALYFIGNALFGWNDMAPWFSYPTRTAICRRFNLKVYLSVFVEFFMNKK